MMFDQEKIETKIHKTEKKLAELSLRLQYFHEEYEKLLEECELSPTELKTYIESPDNFSKETWEHLQQEKKQLDEKLITDLSQVRDPNKAKQTLMDQSIIQQHWLFVR